MARHYPMSSFPNGWYAVSAVSELERGKVLAVRVLGRDLVAFRTESGVISVLDAHCPHQGAHLGHGGIVKGETIECPFHKWCFDAAGKCHAIPYTKCMPKTKKTEIRAYPTLVRQGMILVYYAHDNSAPTWEVPQFEEDTKGNWSEISFAEMTMKAHIYELAENGFDVAHFQPVHGSEENSIELDKKQPFGPELLFSLNLVYPGNGIGRFGKKVGVHVSWRFSGLGIFDNHVTLRDYPMELRQYFFFTPLDEERVRIQVGLRINEDKIKLPQPFRYLVVKMIEKQNIKIMLQNFEQDRPIWENKVFREHPILCEGDGPIGHLRTWMKQFFPQNFISKQSQEVTTEARI
ncbi:MAG: Rieske 2Fe-2S domain-containing protein [Verrucomicrobiota bacterium]|nr:Rieske 2Fe-2S domain-containing protein [Verrucomicrobiota bacterium]